MRGENIKYFFRYLKENGIYANYISEAKNYNIDNLKKYVEKDEVSGILSTVFPWSRTKMGEVFWYTHFIKFSHEFYEKYKKNKYVL